MTEGNTDFESLDTSLAFDVGKQAAIFGWCLKDRAWFEQCSRVVQEEWFSDSYVGLLYGAATKLLAEFHRVPTPLELKSYRPFMEKDARDKKRLEDALVMAMKKTEVYGLDVIRHEMTDWMHSVTFYRGIQNAVKEYNARHVEKAWEVLQKATLQRSVATFEQHAEQGFEDASKRIVDERAERMEQAPRILRYGMDFLDDTLGGIIPNDLILLGAKTGSGKTALATSAALTNSQLGHRVDYFALEGERGEIERRIKYGMVSEAYYLKGLEPISYADWRMGKLDKLLRPIEEELEPEYKKAVANLRTLYRTSGYFDSAALEKALLDVVTKTRLIVIDHLHYIDTQDDENADYKRVIKLVRDIVLRYSVPVIMVAHLRKNQRFREVPLVNDIEDFHGTSDVPKAATTAVMIGPAYDQFIDKSYVWPTYVRPVKCRLDGARMRYTGLCYFNSRTSRYESGYHVGKLRDYDTRWDWEDPRKADDKRPFPKWFKSAFRPDASGEIKWAPTPTG